jgi:hypothetical protein
MFFNERIVLMCFAKSLMSNKSFFLKYSYNCRNSGVGRFGVGKFFEDIFYKNLL